MANTTHNGRKTTLVKIAAASAAIEAGDLVYLASNAATPASSQTDNVGEEANQAEFARKFLGVSRDASPSGTTDAIMVDTGTDVEYTFTVVSGTYRTGDLLGISEASGTELADQVLEAVTSLDLAIVKVSDDSASARTSVKGRLIRTLFAPVVKPRADVNTQTLSGDLVLTHDSPEMHFLDPDGSARNVDLPAEEESEGLLFWICNTADGAETITVRDDAAATIATLAQNEHGYFLSNGTIWVGTANTET